MSNENNANKYPVTFYDMVDIFFRYKKVWVLSFFIFLTPCMTFIFLKPHQYQYVQNISTPTMLNDNAMLINLPGQKIIQFYTNNIINSNPKYADFSLKFIVSYAKVKYIQLSKKGTYKNRAIIEKEMKAILTSLKVAVQKNIDEEVMALSNMQALLRTQSSSLGRFSQRKYKGASIFSLSLIDTKYAAIQTKLSALDIALAKKPQNFEVVSTLIIPQKNKMAIKLLVAIFFSILAASIILLIGIFIDNYKCRSIVKVD